MEWIKFSAPTATVLSAAVLIFLLRLVGVAVSTMRTLVMMRGRKIASVVLGFLEVLVWVMAIGPVAKDPTDIWKVMGYCLGFCAGTLLGMWFDDRFVVGHSVVRIVTRAGGRAILERIHAAGFGATLQQGAGRDGEVEILTAIVRRKEVHMLCDVVQEADPKSFITIEEARSVQRGYLRVATKTR